MKLCESFFWNLGLRSWVMAESRAGTSLLLPSELGGRSVPSHSPPIFSPRRKGLCGFIFGVSPLGRLICQRGFLEVQFALAELRSCFSGSSWEVPLPFGMGLTCRRWRAASKHLLPMQVPWEQQHRRASLGCPELLSHSIFPGREIVYDLGIAEVGHWGEDISGA